MKTKAIPSIHISLQEKDGSVAWVWYLFFQWLAENVGKVDLSDYFTKEETEALLDTKVDKTDTASQIYGTNEDGEQTTYDLSEIGGNVDIDEITITKNADDEIQAEGVINHNEETDATNPIYDWVGTLAEYEEQDIENEHPDWVCYITDDYAENSAIRREVAERNIGEIVHSLVPVLDAGLHLLDGDILDGAGIYEAFYSYMVGLYSSAPQIFCSEEDWQDSVTTYGVCGKFVLDTENVTIRLPKVTGFVEGTIVLSEIGALVEAGLPNITGKFASDESEYQRLPITQASGAFSNGGSSTQYAHDIDGGWHSPRLNGVSFDASRSSPIYGNSTTVQPQAIKGYIYMVVANTIKTPVEVDIDQVATDLSHKVDKGHQLIEWQDPDANSNYTWYRLYADGWVEQGGLAVYDSNPKTITFPIAMADTNYTGMAIQQRNADTGGVWAQINTKATTGFVVGGYYASGSAGNADSSRNFNWQVSGMAAS